MRTPTLTGFLAACSLSMLSSASAQPIVTAPAVDPPPAFDIGPDDEVVMREYIIRRRPPPPAPVAVAPAPVVTAPAPVVVAPPPAVIIRPGSIIPADVELLPFDDAPLPALRRYSYFVSPSNKIVVVEPVERRVVRVLER